jgi:hypothetical protein
MRKTMTFDELAEDILGYNPMESFEDYVDDYTFGQAYDQWMDMNAEDPDDPTPEEQEEAEGAAMEAETQVMADYYSQYQNETENYIEELLSHHNIDVVFDQGKAILSSKDWDEAASLLLDTINGYGMFEYESVEEFVDSTSKDGTAQDTVLSHLHHVGLWQEVYEGGTTQREMARRLERIR